MPKRFDCEDDPNEFMEMPCPCDCGKWFDLNDGHSSSNSNKVICQECKENEEQIDALRERYLELDRSEKPHKREKSKIIQQLQQLGETI